MSVLERPRVFVVGVGITKFQRPLTKQWDYTDMGREAGRAALEDAGLSYDDVKSVVASYCYGDPTCGQRAVYEIGLSGVPVYNVNNNCSSGSTALMMARRLVQSGVEDCVLALGFEKMERGLSERYPEKTSPVSRHMAHMITIGAEPGLIQSNMNSMTSDVVKLFAYAAREYMKKFPQTRLDDFIEIAYKNHKQSINNPKACISKEIPKSDIGSKSLLCEPITFWMSAPVADGGAAAVVCSEGFMLKHNLHNRAVEILSQHMVTDLPTSFGDSFMDLAGVGMARKAAAKCYKESGMSSSDIDVLEVHDCFSCNELFMYEAMQLAPDGHAVELLRSGYWKTNSHGGDQFVLGGRWVVNPSGGLESKGHPIGATGLAQCAELVSQLRGESEKRQVDGARVALQHNFGIGGAAVVSMYKKFEPSRSTMYSRL